MASRLKGRPPEQCEPAKPKVIVFGSWGVGKTYTALDFPRCYYIDTEGGAKQDAYIAKLKASNGWYVGPEDGALDFNEVLSQFQGLATEQHDYQTVIIDSISKLYNTVTWNEQERLGDGDVWGASKKPALAMVRRLINWIDRIDMNIILIAHEKDKYGLVGAKREMVEVIPDVWDKLNHELELIVRIESVGPRRTMRPTKSRLPNLKVGDVHDWSYEKFADRYGRDVIERNAKKIELASAEQIAEIDKLAELLKEGESYVNKLLEKAKAETPAEFSTEQADKTIQFLKGKLAA